MTMTNNNSIVIFKRIVLTILFSVVSIFLVFPLISKLQFLKNLFNSASWKTVIGLSALNVLILIALSEKAVSFWKRYYNTTKEKFSRLVFACLLLSYFILSGFLIYFFIDNKWPIVLYLNLIIFSIWIYVTLFLGIRLSKKRGEAAALTINEKILSDEPIRYSAQDQLGREKFVDDLYGQISKLPLPLTGSFTIGLYGSWGEGKTSVLNLLEEKFKNRDDFLIIRFDPWYFEKGDAILAAFYNQIETAISDQFVLHGFKKIIERYKKIISTGFSFSGISFGLKDQDDSIEKTKMKIEDFIRRIDRKLLIIIDDIDRLQPDEASLIFKLVRKNTNFSNTIFLLSFDPAVVGNYLNGIITGDSEFIDKVINMPLSLPAIEQENIDNFLFEEINELFDFLEIPGEKKDAFEKNFHQDVYHSFIKKLIKTLRQAKRYLNGIYATLP